MEPPEITYFASTVVTWDVLSVDINNTKQSLLYALPSLVLGDN